MLSQFFFLNFARRPQIIHHVCHVTKQSSNRKMPIIVLGWSAALLVAVVELLTPCFSALIVVKHFIHSVSTLQFIVWTLHPLLAGVVPTARFVRYQERHPKMN
jgi:CBS domain containing-hemolysin-like protein